jgi:hypothetical protein
MKKQILPLMLFIVSIIYLFLRLNQLESKLTFHLDQGLQLGEAYQMVQTHHLTLIGPMVTTKTFQGRAFFIGPFYTYVLAILGVISQWNPLTVTVLMIIFEFLSFLLFIIWLLKHHQTNAVLWVFFLAATTPFLIEHSRFFWNPHFLLPLSFLLIYFLEKKKYFFTALIWGLGFSFHYSALLWGLPILFYLIKNREKFTKYLIFIPGFILGDLPFYIFEIKHNFYNIRTMLLVFTNTNKAGEMSPYYFVFPFFAFFIFLLTILYKKSKRFFYLILFITIIFNIFYKFKLQERIPVGMPDGWTYPVQKQVLKLITQNGCPSDFNIATTISGDTQAHDLRYLLTVDHCTPDSVDNYPHDSVIFLIAPPSRPPETETVWEISSFKPFTVKSMVKLNDQIILYRLEKSNAFASKNN